MATNTAPSNYTPVSLGHGLELLVLKGYEQSTVTQRLIERCKELLDLDAHMKAIEHAVSALASDASDDSMEALDFILESFGWLNNHTDRSAEDVAAAIRALLSLCSAADIIAASDIASCELYKLWQRQHDKEGQS